LEGRRVERVDGRTVRSRERKVDVLARRSLLDQSQGAALARDVEAEGVAVADPQADDRSHGLVEESALDNISHADPEVIDGPDFFFTRARVSDSFDAVLLRVENEGAVVVGAVLRPQARVVGPLIGGMRRV